MPPGWESKEQSGAATVPADHWLAGWGRGQGLACEWQRGRVSKGQGLLGKCTNSLLWAGALCPWMGRSVRAGAADCLHWAKP